ncbi:MAG: FtsX-like permease family protein [Dehalococcoidia bacterium]
MTSILPFLRLAIARIASNRVLLATVGLGILLSSALMSTVILYTDAVRDLGLKHALGQEDQAALDVRIASSGHPARGEDYTRRRERTLDVLRGYLGGQLQGTQLAGRSDTLYLAPAGEEPETGDNRPRSHYQFVSGMEDRVETVEGVAFGTAGEDEDVIEAWVASSTAERFGIEVGDTYDQYPFWRNDNSFVTMRVVGIVEARDAESSFWRGRKEWVDEDSTRWPTYVFLISEDGFASEVAGIIPDIDGSFETFGIIDRATINSANAGRVQGGTDAVDVILREEIDRTTVQTTLGTVLADYSQRAFFTRVPLFALMIQVIGIVLYYLVMVATMVVERQSGEIALLRGRGATSGQIMGLFGLEAALLCLVLGAAGPLVAAVGISALGVTPPFEDLSGNTFLDVRLTWPALLMGWVGALIAFAAMLIPAYRATRMSIVEHQRSVARPPKQPLFLRYYLDLVLIAVGGLAFYQLRRQDSLVSERLFGGLSADPLLLISPTLFMLMCALAFLRLFPVALRAASWATRALPGPTLALGLWRMTRAPLHYSRLILLLLLATAVGMFAASFRATLDRSYDDRAAFEAGAEGRVVDIRAPEGQTNDEMAALVQDATGSQAATSATRTNASYIIGPLRTQSLTMLGVIPGEIEPLAAWRNDFSGSSMEELLEPLGEPVELVRGPSIAAGTRVLGVWVEGEIPRNQARLMVRVVDAEGRHSDFDMQDFGLTDEAGRHLFVGDVTGQLPRAREQAPPPPERWLESIFVRALPQDGNVRARATFVLDDLTGFQSFPADLTAARAEGATVIEDFESLESWQWLAGATPQPPEGSLSPSQLPGVEGNGMRVNYVRGPGLGVVGATVKASYPPLSVVADEGLLDAHDLGVGDEIRLSMNSQYVQAVIVGKFELFPTYYPSDRDQLLVADLRSLQVVANRVPFFGRDLLANEVWLQGAASPILSPDDLRPAGVSAQSTYDRDSIRAADASNPLVAASWEGILFLSFAAVLSLTALGFAVHARVSATSRGLEFAVLRSMGYSTRQVFTLVGFEQLFVVVLGVAAGTLLGFPLGRLMIGYLSRTETGAEPVPPLISEVSLAAVLTVYVTIGLVIVVTVVSLAVLYSRIAVSRMLRVGEV